jgi:hypothetical protein
MKKYAIELSRDQYRNLLNIVFLGQWMTLSCTDQDEDNVLDLEQSIFSYARQFESADLIEYDEEIQLYFPSFEFEEKAFDLVDDYDDFMFWDGLAERLAKRDLYKKYGDSISTMDIDARLEEEQQLIDRYLRYFENKGLESVHVDLS